MPITTLYLIRHGATAANLDRPYRLQGRQCDDPLSPIGVHQAEQTRQALAERPARHYYCSPLRRAVETAQIIAGPRAASVVPVSELIECDVGRWEGLSWESIRQLDAPAYERFLADPSVDGYPEGENFQAVAARVIPAVDALLEKHVGETLLVVGHHVVNRVYLASLFGLPPSKARRVRLDNCGISIVLREEDATWVTTLNATFHLRNAAWAA